jgi:hypothetical protein
MLAAARLLTALLLARSLLGPYWEQQLAIVIPSAVPRACETRQWQLWFRHHRLHSIYLHGIYVLCMYVSTPRRSQWSGVERGGGRTRPPRYVL